MYNSLMVKYAVVKTGGKQYLVKETDEIVVEKLSEDKKSLELETLATFEADGTKLELGTPFLKSKTKAEIVESLKGDKIRVARFKSKVRYRKVRGFRPQLSKIKITAV